MRLVARPIETWPGQLHADSERQLSRFSTAWGDTVDLLEREARALGADEVIVQLAITERDCRLDGWIRADAKPTHPGVIVSLDSRHGPLRYSTDVFSRGSVWRGGGSGYVTIPGWQCNVRAVALGLEALRKVDRYGIAQGGEQYRGWQALPPGTPMPAAQMTVDEAARLIYPEDPDWMLDVGTAEDVRREYRHRVITDGAHPDQGGDPDHFRRLTEARDLLTSTR